MLAQTHLTRTEYVENSDQSGSKCFRLLGNKERKVQQFVIGTRKGKLQLYKPLHGYVVGQPMSYPLAGAIEHVELASYGKDFRDRIFYTDGVRISGVTKRSVQVAKFVAQDLTESLIAQLWIENRNFYVLTQKNSLAECWVDKTGSNATIKRLYQLTPQLKARVNDMCLLNPEAKSFDSVLACEDNSIHVVRSGTIRKTYSTSAMPLALAIEGRTNWVEKPIFYNSCYVALRNGRIVILQCGETQVQATQTLHTEAKSEIRRLHLYDLTRNGKADLFVASLGGALEFYERGLNDTYELSWQGEFSQIRVMDLDGGTISDALYREFLVTTEDGRVMGYGMKTRREVQRTLGSKPLQQSQQMQQQAQGQQQQQQIQQSEMQSQQQKQALKNGGDSNAPGSPFSGQKKLAHLMEEVDELEESVSELKSQRKIKKRDSAAIQVKKNPSKKDSLQMAKKLNNFIEVEEDVEEEEEGSKTKPRNSPENNRATNTPPLNLHVIADSDDDGTINKAQGKKAPEQKLSST